MISGTHYSIMTDEEFDFSDKEHEAALRALIKDGTVEVVLDENGYRELRLTEIAKLTRSGSLTTGAIPYPEHCSPANGVSVCAQHASLTSAGVNKKGGRFFWIPDSGS